MTVPLRRDMIRQIIELIETKMKIVRESSGEYSGESIHQINLEYIHQIDQATNALHLLLEKIDLLLNK